MLTYDLSENDMPIYEKLYTLIKKDIEKGYFNNSKLPSKRNLANHLNISLTTVQSAYEQLISEDYIYSIPKKGYYINNKFLGTKNFCFEQDNKKIDIPQKKIEECTLDKKIDLRLDNFNTELFPFSVWLKLKRKIVSQYGKILLNKSDSNGIYALRRAIANHLYSFRGVRVNPNNIVIGAGTEYLYNLLIQLLGREKIFGVENPGYSKISKIYKSNNVKIDYISVNEKGLNLEELKTKKIDILHITPNHHFPLGLTMDEDTRVRLLNWTNNNERFIVEDDFDSEFTFLGRPMPTLQSIDNNQKVIYMNTFSKTLAPSIRISYMILPDNLMKKYNNNLDFYSCTVSTFDQYTLEKFISEGYFDKHLNRLKKDFRKKRDLLITTLKNSKSRNIYTITGENSGLNFILKIDTKISDKDLIRKSEERGLLISSISQFYVESKKAPQHSIVINYERLGELQAKKIAEILDEILLPN